MNKAEDSLSNKEEILGQVPLFSRLNEKHFKKLAELCVSKSFAKDEFIIKEGNTGLGLFLIISGKVEVYKGEGEKKVSLKVLQSVDILGEMALVDDRPRSASAQALEPTECLLITRDSFKTLIEKEPRIAWCIVSPLVERVRESQTKIVELEMKLREATAKSTDPQVTAEVVEDSHDPGESKYLPVLVNQPARPGEQNPLLQTLRAQNALLMAGVEGLSGWIGLWGTFWSSLAKETKLTQSDRLVDVIAYLPGGYLSAVRTTLDEAVKLPNKVVDSFRHNLKRK